MSSRIKDPTILFQYQSTEKLAKLLDGLKQVVIDNSKEDIFNFFNLDDAVGLWLDQLGAYLNIERPLISGESNSNIYQFQDNEVFQFQSGNPFLFNVTPPENGVFITDLSLMDGTDILDGTALASDDLYRSYIKGQIARRNSRFTINEIINVLQFTISGSSIFIVESVKTLTIYAGVPDTQTKINTDLLNNLDPKWFGLPTGVGLESFNTFVMPPDANFLITDFNDMDNINNLMV